MRSVLTDFERKWLEYVRKEKSISPWDPEIVMPSDRAALNRLVRMGYLKLDEALYYSENKGNQP